MHPNTITEIITDLLASSEELSNSLDEAERRIRRLEQAAEERDTRITRLDRLLEVIAKPLKPASSDVEAEPEPNACCTPRTPEQEGRLAHAREVMATLRARAERNRGNSSAE